MEIGQQRNFIFDEHLSNLGQSWIWYSGNDCTGTAYAEPEFYEPEAVFASPFDGASFFVDQTATLNNVTAQSRYIVDSNTLVKSSTTHRTTIL
ncbi:MAG: hypothetical protein AAF849_17940 [Bacteroidota bacterium]